LPKYRAMYRYLTEVEEFDSKEEAEDFFDSDMVDIASQHSLESLDLNVEEIND
jgi:hypothetical protein